MDFSKRLELINDAARMFTQVGKIFERQDPGMERSYSLALSIWNGSGILNLESGAICGNSSITGIYGFSIPLSDSEFGQVEGILYAFDKECGPSGI